MGIELPETLDVETAIAAWRDKDPRLGALLARHSLPAQALRHYGLILWGENQPETAARVFTAAVALAPYDPKLWADLSGALNAVGALHQAEACMKEALLRDQTSADGWLRLGSIKSALEDAPGAEAAFKTALALDPSLTDARLSLGLCYFADKRFDEATEHLRAVLVENPNAIPAVQACYGQALFHTGDFAGAAVALNAAHEREPENQSVALKLALAAFLADILVGPLDAAMDACRARRVVTPAEFEKISRQAFHLLGAFGHPAAAIRLGEVRLARTPDDLECAYLLAVLRGEPLVRSPDTYVAAFFDKFAEEFDAQLVGVLHYKGCQQLADLVEAHVPHAAAVLDLGCGTGLAGPLLARAGRRLIGVDLSSGMLDKARARHCYDELIQAEALAFVGDKPNAFDLVFVADMLIYIGDLSELIQAVARALNPGGVFAFTLESGAADTFALQPTGRFTHNPAHILALTQAAALKTLVIRSIQIRFETKGFVDGELIVVQRAER